MKSPAIENLLELHRKYKKTKQAYHASVTEYTGKTYQDYYMAEQRFNRALLESADEIMKLLAETK